MASGTITKVLKLKDEASPALKRVAKGAADVADEMDNAEEIAKLYTDTNGKLRDEFGKFVSQARKVELGLVKVGNEAQEASGKSGKLGAIMGGPVGKGLKMAGAAAMALGAGFAALGVSAIGVAADMERYEAQLSTILKSSGAAKERLAELFEIGSTTPFELEALVRADTVLESFGANAAELRLGVMDLAGALGGELPDAAMAVAKSYGAGKAASDGLRESYALLFNDIVERANKMGDPADINVWRAAMTEALNDVNGVVAGGTAKLAATFQGQLSNMSDAWFKFRKEIADAGLFVHAKAALGVVLERIGENKVATQEWAALISGQLTEGFFAIGQLVAWVGQGVLSWAVILQTVENGARAYAGIMMEIVQWHAQAVVFAIKLHQEIAALWDLMAHTNTASNLDAPLRAAESAVVSLKLSVLENNQAIGEGRLAILEMGDRINDLGKTGEVFDDIRARANELEDALHLEGSISLAVDPDTAAAMAALGIPLPGVSASAPKRRSSSKAKKSTGASKGSKELSGLTGQVESFTKQMFPISRMEAANRLIAELHAAQDRASGTRRAAFAELITQAEAARRALGAAGLASDMESLAKSLDATSKSLDSVGELAQAAAADLEAAAAAQLDAASAALQMGISAATDVGSAMPALGMAVGGPAGAAAGSALSALSDLGQQADGEGGLEEMVEANVRGFVEGFKVLIEQLPGLISMLPDLLAEVIPDLIIALVENMPAMAKAFMIDLPIALSEAFGKAFARIWDAIKDFFNKLFGFDEFSDKTKDTFHALTLGLFEGKQTGGMIDRTGLFMLHQNERVIPSSGAAPQGARGMMAGGGGGVNITINTNVVDPNSIDQLGRMLQRHFGSMGRSTLPIFGGG